MSLTQTWIHWHVVGGELDGRHGSLHEYQRHRRWWQVVGAALNAPSLGDNVSELYQYLDACGGRLRVVQEEIERETGGLP